MDISFSSGETEVREGKTILQNPMRKPWDFRVSEDSLNSSTPNAFQYNNPEVVIFTLFGRTQNIDKVVVANLDTTDMLNPGHCEQVRQGLLLLSGEDSSYMVLTQGISK